MGGAVTGADAALCLLLPCSNKGVDINLSPDQSRDSVTRGSPTQHVKAFPVWRWSWRSIRTRRQLLTDSLMIKTKLRLAQRISPGHRSSHSKVLEKVTNDAKNRNAFASQGN